MSNLRATFLLAALSALLLAVGNAAGGHLGMAVAVPVVLAIGLGAYWLSDKLVLSMYRAEQVGPYDAPLLYETVRELSPRAGLRMPKVYLIDSEVPNAFATGRSRRNAAVAATTGLLAILERDELAGVMAHELAHIKHRDTLTGAVATTIADTLGMLANVAQWAVPVGDRRNVDGDEPRAGVLQSVAGVLLAPVVATLMRLAFSHSRELAADAQGAAICGDPLCLANALRKLDDYHRGMLRPPAHAPIVHRLQEEPSRRRLFSAHPPLDERIRRLEAALYDPLR